MAYRSSRLRGRVWPGLFPKRSHHSGGHSSEVLGLDRPYGRSSPPDAGRPLPAARSPKPLIFNSLRPVPPSRRGPASRPRSTSISEP
ncbi:MAG: hypothetical protein M0C28_40200 [Candidatus Moduliflexus flocculans]|nr:hypothetical protein [Candidatus Moduliflexus flocculans]